ncbi:MAG: bifunctional phosphoribosylaminoimidazolecarboxamide formyltransferase/IMP cyclohydrolase [Patescibacteria group bacterium]
MPKRALLSVADKRGLLPFAKGLAKAGFEMIATGGTLKALRDEGISAISVEEITGVPEMLGGRVKTMHPKITGGILLRRDHPKDLEEAKKHGIEPIDLVAINLYPFEETIAKASVTREEAIEQMDIGGPALLRSAAKNHTYVTAVCDPLDYDRVLKELKSEGHTSAKFRSELAAKVFLRTAAYDTIIAEYLGGGATKGILLVNGMKLRYGENPHQKGWFYNVFPVGQERSCPTGKTPWTMHQGKELSYLNLLDADAAWNLIQDFPKPTAACIKHANPSGVASHADITEAFQRAYDADRLSAFGVIIALNRPCTEEIARKIINQKIFTEVVVAPEFEGDALNILKEKPNIRCLTIDGELRKGLQYRSAVGGLLVQDHDVSAVKESDFTIVSKKRPTKEQIQDLLFAWTVVKHAKSNAIVFAKDRITVGIGCGQTSRIDSTWIAAKRAGEKAKGAVMASDAFFPFPDSVEEAAKHGIGAVIQPGGSIRDSEVFAKADELGLAMATTGVRAFRH